MNEIAVNTVKQKVNLSKVQKKALKKYKIDIEKLSCYTKNSSKRKKLVGQSGGFLPILIPTVASILTTLLAK